MRQLRHVAAERCADLAKHREGEIPQATLDTAHIRPINIGAGGEFFLSPAEHLPALPYALPEEFKDVLIHESKARRNGDYESTDEDTLLGDGRAGSLPGFPVPADHRRADRLAHTAAFPVDDALKRRVADAVFFGVAG